MAGVGGLAALGIGGFLFVRRRKDRAEAGPSSSMTSAFPSDLKPNSTTGKVGRWPGRHGQQLFPDRLRQDRPRHDRHRRGRPGRRGRGLHRLRPRCAGRGDPQGGDGARQGSPRDRAEAPRDLPRAQERHRVRDGRQGAARAPSAIQSRCGRRPPRWARRSIPTIRSTRAAGGAAATYAATAPAAKPDVDFDLDRARTPRRRLQRRPRTSTSTSTARAPRHPTCGTTPAAVGPRLRPRPVRVGTGGGYARRSARRKRSRHSTSTSPAWTSRPPSRRWFNRPEVDPQPARDVASASAPRSTSPT